MKLKTIFSAAILAGFATVAAADTTPQGLPYSQNWTGIAVAADDWSAVPGVVGYRGDDLTAATGTDPQTILADGAATPFDAVIGATPTSTAGGVAFFEGPTVGDDAVVALQGSGTADAPHIVIHLNTTGFEAISVSYDLRDVDGTADNAIQQFALQYRVGNTGDYTNIPAAYVADASVGPSLTQSVSYGPFVLPSDADNVAVLCLRFITTNALGNDEWIGPDNISVTGTPTASVSDWTTMY